MSGAFLFRGVWALVHVGGRVQEVTADVEGEGQQAAVQVHDHIFLSRGAEESRQQETVDSSAFTWRTLTDLILLQGEQLVARRAAAHQFSTSVEGGEAQPGKQRFMIHEERVVPVSESESFQTGGRRFPVAGVPVRQVPARLQAHSAPTWLTQGIPFEDDEAVGVGDQQVKPKVKASPPPAILKKNQIICE